MKRKYKMTGCAKFLIFLIFFAPIAYFGAQYVNDNGGIEALKERFNIEVVDDADSGEVSKKELQQKVLELEKTIRKQKIEIKYLEAQLEKATGK